MDFTNTPMGPVFDEESDLEAASKTPTTEPKDTLDTLRTTLAPHDINFDDRSPLWRRQLVLLR